MGSWCFRGVLLVCWDGVFLPLVTPVDFVPARVGSGTLIFLEMWHGFLMGS